MMEQPGNVVVANGRLHTQDFILDSHQLYKH